MELLLDVKLSPEQIGMLCHQANKAICESFGDHSQVTWSEAADWQRESAINGVKYRLDNPDAPESAQHDAWTADKLAAGWKYGPVKDAVKKEHPCLVPFNELPPEQQVKDSVFCAIVDCFR